MDSQEAELKLGPDEEFYLKPSFWVLAGHFLWLFFPWAVIVGSFFYQALPEDLTVLWFMLVVASVSLGYIFINRHLTKLILGHKDLVIVRPNGEEEAFAWDELDEIYIEVVRRNFFPSRFTLYFTYYDAEDNELRESYHLSELSSVEQLFAYDFILSKRPDLGIYGL